MSYWNYTMQYPLLYASALRRTTGEDLFEHRFFKGMPLYVPHMLLPGARFQFDFADWGPRVNADGKTAQRGYEMPWHTLRAKLYSYVPLFKEVNDPLLRAVIARVVPMLDPNDATDADLAFAMLWQLRVTDHESTGDERTSIPPYHYFDDADVLHWRQNWTDDSATALAFKSGPPAGHHIAALYPLYPEWRASLGHAHPDAGSFILFARGAFLANDTGYAIKESRWHNTITIDGVGQGTGCTAWNTWAKLPYEKLNAIRMTDVWLGPRVAAATAVFEDAYKSIDVAKAHRHLILIDGTYLVILDDLESVTPHVYDWFLHTDRMAEPAGSGRWTMRNGAAPLTVQNVNTIDAANVEPTIVETELYDKNITRPQQRGFHLNLRSPRSKAFRFLTAMAIGSSDDRRADFAARKVDENVVELIDGDVSCRVWCGPSVDFDGTFAFVVRERNEIRVIGLSGTRLKTEAGTLEVPRGGQVVLTRSSTGMWSDADNGRAPAWKLR